MLDGLLGRSGFFSKCKSLIKQTRKRINVVKKKRSATHKFMRKDIADLLANGLENNAYGRAEGLIMDMILSSCYDFVDHVCEIVLKHLSVLQKLRECPEDCREDVASLMFAAARFSDLPELRELRDLFQERYGSSVEYYVNEKLVENVTPKPPSMEKKVQLMQDIALEFSIWWDSRAFVERMSRPPAAGKNQRQIPGMVDAIQKKVSARFVGRTGHTTVSDEGVAKSRSDSYRNKERNVAFMHQVEKQRDSTIDRRDGLKHEQLAEHTQVRALRMKQEHVTDRPKPDFRNAIPPPYVKPRKSKHKSNLSSRHANDDVHADKKDTFTLNPGSKSDKSEGVASPENETSMGRFTEIYYRDASSSEFTPRRRSHRRKHSRSMSTQDDKIDGKAGREEERVLRRVSTSQRKHELRKGLLILVDDEHYEDEEERMIDRLLLHYSRKPSSFDPGKSRIKTNNEVKGATKSPLHKSLEETKANDVSAPMTSRSMSFPPQVIVPEQQKVFARASSFQRHSPAKHVHPKLPDYDDLAARFAALKASKG